MAEAANGHARFEDLRSNVVTYTEKVHNLDVEVARISECLVHIEDKIDLLQESITKLKENDDPKSLREKANTWVQILTVLLVIVSMIIPHWK